MSSAEYRPRRRPRPRRRRRWARWLAGLVLLAVVFALGVALGQALRSNPKPGATITDVRKLRPLALPPARETVTVTTAR